jgi:hypothetical protein
VDVGAVVATGFEDIDPQAVELRLDVPGKVAGEGGGVPGERAREVGEKGIAARQVVEGGVAGVALVAMLARPAAAGCVVLGKGADGVGEFGEVEVEVGFVERSGEEVAHGAGVAGFAAAVLSCSPPSPGNVSPAAAASRRRS